MRKIVCIIMLFTLVFLNTISFAETELNLAAMTTEELTKLHEEISKELLFRTGLPFIFYSAQFGLHMPVEVKASPDIYTAYVPDFIGMNFANIGTYDEEDNIFYFKFGPPALSYMILNYITVDGEAIDLQDREQKKQYVVVWQSPAPNTEVKYSYLKIGDYEQTATASNVTLSGITLYLAKIENK